MQSIEQIMKEIEQLLPPRCRLTKIELEGPMVALYIDNPQAFYAEENIIARIAAKVKKRICIRCDAALLKPMDEALTLLKECIPAEAGVKSIRFNQTFGEVLVEALKPGLAIGKGGEILRKILITTHWSPRILRAPTRASEVEASIRAQAIAHAEERKRFLLNLGKKISLPSKECEWIKLTALGGFKEVGRSCLLLQTPNTNLLIDCGINTDTTDPAKAYPYLSAAGLTLDQIDAVIVTHAHLDHVGFVPFLYAYGYNGPTYATEPTRDLATLLQQDYIKIAHAEVGKAPYGEKDIRRQLTHTITVNYHEVTDVSPDIRFTFANAGHILGSAMVHLHIGNGLFNILVTSDFKYARTNLFDPAEARFPRVEALVMEATYGGSEDHQPRLEEGEARLLAIIREVVERGGKALIPVFAVGRAQEVALILEKGLKGTNIPIYLDGMSLEASAIHTVYPEFLKRTLQHRILSGDSPFDDPMFVSMAGRDRKDVVESTEPCVILAPSGMLTGGPSVAFLKLMAEDARNALIFVGYQAPMTLGRRIQAGAREVPILGEGQKVETLRINCSVHTIDAYSGHSDRSQLLAFAYNLRPRPQRVFTMHGENTKCDELARSVGHALRRPALAPNNLESVRLK